MPETSSTPTDCPRPLAISDAVHGHAASAYSPVISRIETLVRHDQVKVMIVDDEPINIDLLQIYLGEFGFKQFCAVTDSREALATVRAQRPDVVLLDLMMPHVSGFDILRGMRADPKLKYTPVIILTAASDPESKFKALELGVNDFLSKPVDTSELVLRLRNTLGARALQDHLANYSAKLERKVKQRTAELEASRLEAMHCLARAAEFRDDDTGQHVIRVGRYVSMIAKKLGFSQEIAAILEQAAQLHDVGKIGIPDSVLLKPGRLEPHEFELMQQHCHFGKTIIQPMTDDEWQALRSHTQIGASILGTPSSPIMKLAASIATTHHEKWDGSGYPRGLSGEEIPIEGRITAVADVYDALSNKRPYKEAFPAKKCVEIMVEGRGKHFDPRVLDAFFACFKAVLQVQAEFADPGE